MEQTLQSPIIISASSNRRFVNLFIDTVLYEIVMLVIINPIAILILGKGFFSNYWNGFLLAMLMQFLYYLGFEAAFQRTPGKFITGTKVIMLDGSKPDIGTITKRTLIRLVPFEVISMYTGKSLQEKGTWWHDRWAATRVVRNQQQ
jgi:uncharacterized RDD family membrane protein YckC